MRRSLSLSVGVLALASPLAVRAEPATYVYTARDCLVTSQQPTPGQTGNLIGAIAAILVPALVEMGIEAVQTDLKKIRKVESSGALDFNLWRRVGDDRELGLALPKCITVVTGEFPAGASSEELAGDIVTTTAVEHGADAATLMARLAANGISADKLYSVFEAQTDYSPDKSGYYYRPVYMKVFGFMPSQKARSPGLVYNLSLLGPGAGPWGTTYSSAPISFGAAPVGTELHLRGTNAMQTKLAGLKTGMLAMPGISENSFLAYISDVQKKQIPGFMPVSLKADMVQTQKPSDAALFLAGLLEKAKGKIVERAGSVVAPDADFKRRQAHLDAQIAVQTAAKALADAQNAVPVNDAAVRLAELQKQKADAALAELEK